MHTTSTNNFRFAYFDGDLNRYVRIAVVNESDFVGDRIDVPVELVENFVLTQLRNRNPNLKISDDDRIHAQIAATDSDPIITTSLHPDPFPIPFSSLKFFVAKKRREEAIAKLQTMSDDEVLRMQ